MDSALKQRLIGAAVLVALAVIFVPMLLEGPAPEDEASDLPLTLPDAPARGYETRELPLAPITPANTAATADADGGQTAPTDDFRLATVEAGGTPAPRVDELPLADAEALPPASSRAPADETPPPAAPAPAPSAPATQRPAASAPAPAADGQGRFAVNAGVYSNAANAQSLVAAFRQAGLPAYAENTTWQGRPAQRVRVGPYAMRAEAESARLRVREVRSDVPTGVVALDASPAPASAAAQPAARAPAPAAPA
ncbi:SPOR domain-containing protein, partial [Coralloluteibacterium thermophilus]